MNFRSNSTPRNSAYHVPSIVSMPFTVRILRFAAIELTGARAAVYSYMKVSSHQVRLRLGSTKPSLQVYILTDT